MKSSRLKNNIISPVFIFWILICSCNQNKEITSPVILNEITLKWNKAYTTETQQNVDLGLRWYLSFLGATMPRSTWNEGVKWLSEDKVLLRFDKLGFKTNALAAFAQIITTVKRNEEYQKNETIDLGRWMMLTLNSSNHYYAITGVPKTFNAFKQTFDFGDSLYVNLESTVAKNDRSVQIPRTFGLGNSGFIVNDGSGSIAGGTFVKHSNEVFDIMPNGQLRFAIYDEHGDLIPASDTLYSDAGKPAKCLWCHEINLQIPYGATIDVPGFYSISTFKSIIAQNMKVLESYRSTLTAGVDFTQKQAHTQMELLYISFMNPSVMRLANEWGITEQEVQQKLNALSTHQYGEFPFLGNLYDRNEVERHAPVKTLKVPDFAREPSAYEPNFMN